MLQPNLDYFSQEDQDSEIELNQPEWKIDNDKSAEWAIIKVKQETHEVDRLINACNDQIEFYKSKIQIYENRRENQTNYLKAKLAEYFETVPHTKTKTQEKYELPSGCLVRKQQAPEFKLDENKLQEWLANNNKYEFIKTNPKVDWANLKKQVEVKGIKTIAEEQSYERQAILLAGKEVQGIEVIPRPDKFEVKF